MYVAWQQQELGTCAETGERCLPMPEVCIGICPWVKSKVDPTAL